MLRRLVDAHPETVQLVYRHFPLNNIHAHAQQAAEAAEAAGSQDSFWSYHDALYESQGEWANLSEAEARQHFIDLADELELDVQQFIEELDGRVHADYVTSLEQEAIGLGLPGTPSVLVDGQPVAGESLPRDITIWENYIAVQVSLAELTDMQYENPPEMTIDVTAAYQARVQMEDGGEFVIELLPSSAPQTVNNFIFLAREGWYDGVTFHRVVPGFVAQTGDPTATGAGGPGYTVPDELDPELSHEGAGVVAMANSGPNTNGSQWYITYADAQHLDGRHTIFGRVSQGMDVVEQLTPRDPANAGAPPGDVIASITIEELE